MTEQPQQTRFPIALTSFGALLIIGILLPWAKLFYFVSVSGIELGEGTFMLILAILITCCGARTYFNQRRPLRFFKLHISSPTAFPDSGKPFPEFIENASKVRSSRSGSPPL